MAELLLRSNLRSVRAYLLKEDLQRFWRYVSPYWAGVFLDRWCTRVMRSRLEPMKKVARMLRSHRELILNWFRARGRSVRSRVSTARRVSSPREPTDSAPIAPSKSPCITALVAYPNRTSPTDSAEELFVLWRQWSRSCSNATASSKS